MEPEKLEIEKSMPLEMKVEQDKLKAERTRQKLKEYGVPSDLKAGGQRRSGSPQESHAELKSAIMTRRDELLERAKEHFNNLPISDYSRIVVPVAVVELIPAPIINQQNFDPADSFFDTAIKLERLGLVIKDLTLDNISYVSYNNRRTLMAHCFATAGAYMDKFLKNINPSQGEIDEIYFSVLTDLYQSGGLFYHWAAINMPSPAKEIMDKRAKKFEEGLQAIREVYGLVESLVNAGEGVEEKKDV